MTALQQEAISIIQAMSDERLVLAISKLREVADFKIATYYDEEDANIAKWEADPDKYADEINEWINGIIKEVRKERRERHQ